MTQMCYNKDRKRETNPKEKKEGKTMTYRIINNHGTVDFAATIEEAERKYNRYAKDKAEGYSEFVYLVEVDNAGRETIVK